MRAFVLVSDRTMLAVPLYNTIGVAPAPHTPPFPLKVQVPVPILNTETPPLLLLYLPAVTLYVTASNVPLVWVKFLWEEIDRASAICTVPAVAKIVTGKLNVTPLLVIVCVPRLANVSSPAVLDDVTPVPNFQSP